MVLPILRAEYKEKGVTEQAGENTSRAAAIARAETGVAVAGAVQSAILTAEGATLAVVGTVATLSSGGIAALVMVGASLLGSVIGTPISATVNTKWLEGPLEKREASGSDGSRPTDKNAEGIELPQPSQKFTMQIIEDFREYYLAEINNNNPFIDQGVLDKLAVIDIQLTGDSN